MPWLEYDEAVDLIRAGSCECLSVKITTIPHIYRNVNRMTEILSVLSKYGLADGISRLNLDFAKGLLKNRGGEALARHTRETRVRLAMDELGPTFIKLGQILSTRSDLVGSELANELSQLQDSVSIDPPEVVKLEAFVEVVQFAQTRHVVGEERVIVRVRRHHDRAALISVKQRRVFRKTVSCPER